jgi:cysteine-rich repeat protein
MTQSAPVRALALSTLLLALSACGSDGNTFILGDVGFNGGDTGGSDAGSGDAPDTGEPDGNTPDADTPDADATGPEICDNEVDDDGDGAVDCDDPDCTVSIACGGTCGDAILDDGEDCDDGPNNSDSRADACRTDCTEARCGDDVIDSGEACDEGANNGFGRCTLGCIVVPICGDGVADAPEQCDDGNDNPGDGCDNCVLEREPACGDGLFTPGFEECEQDRDCGPGASCTDDCECVEEAPVCGDGVAEGAEACDGADVDGCGGNAFCTEACTCDTFVCGDNQADGSEECDGSDDTACGAGESCSDACACIEDAPVCGNDRIEGTEECDGAADSACTAGESCSDACECVGAVCGNGVADPTELCDGLDDALCGPGWVCVEGCTCDGPPRLDRFGTPVVGGANPVVIPRPNRSVGVCPDFAFPHGLEVRIVGESAVPVTAVEVQRTGVDPTPIRIALESPLGPALFDERVALCLPTLEENRVHQITLVDEDGRRSPTQSFSLPTLGGVTFSSLRVFLSRDGDAHILQVSGASADANIRAAISNVETTEGLIEAFESAGWPLITAYEGGQFYGAITLGGLSDAPFTITSYDTFLETFGGLQSAPRSVTTIPTAAAGNGAACVPAEIGTVSTCQDGTWCRPGTLPNTGTCTATAGALPQLTVVDDDGFILNSPNCEPDFPNLLQWRMSGTTSVPLVSVLLSIPGIIDDPAAFGLAAIPGPTFDEEIGVCFNGTLRGETVQVALIDELGRETATRSYVVP